MSVKIGFVGLGQMGLPMVANLLRAGFEVIGNDLVQPDISSLPKPENFKFVTSALDTASCDVIILMLPNSKIVDDLLWNQGLAKAMIPGACVLDMSSSHPVNSRQNEKLLKELGKKFVDAPVSGGVKRAIDGSLAIMMGGDKATVDAVDPILKALGKTLVYVGEAGAGHAVKALNNYVSASGLLAAAEALVAAEAFGIDPHIVNQVFNASTGKNNTTENKVEAFMLNEKYNSGFSLALMRKDLETALSFMTSVGKDADFAKQCVDIWQAAEKTLQDKADHTAMHQYIKAK
jgi:3-hydroxyisobutyrate dehydrogenase